MLPESFTDFHGQCLEFRFQMSGPDVGELSIEMRSQGFSWPVWQLRKEELNTWQYGKVSIPASEELPFNTYELAIVGMAGYGSEGYIAVDDTRLMPGRCSVQPVDAVPGGGGSVTFPPSTTPPPGKFTWARSG